MDDKQLAAIQKLREAFDECSDCGLEGFAGFEGFFVISGDERVEIVSEFYIDKEQWKDLG